MQCETAFRSSPERRHWYRWTPTTVGTVEGRMIGLSRSLQMIAPPRHTAVLTGDLFCQGTPRLWSGSADVNGQGMSQLDRTTISCLVSQPVESPNKHPR